MAPTATDDLLLMPSSLLPVNLIMNVNRTILKLYMVVCKQIPIYGTNLSLMAALTTGRSAISAREPALIREIRPRSEARAAAVHPRIAFDHTFDCAVHAPR